MVPNDRNIMPGMAVILVKSYRLLPPLKGSPLTYNILSFSSLIKKK
jgi:hypothetical protein